MLDRKLSVFGAQTVTDILSNYFKRLGSVLFTQIARRHRDILWQMVTKVNWYFIKPLNTRSVSKLRESQSISRSLMQKKRRKLTNEISDIKKKIEHFFSICKQNIVDALSCFLWSSTSCIVRLNCLFLKRRFLKERLCLVSNPIEFIQYNMIKLQAVTNILSHT